MCLYLHPVKAMGRSVLASGELGKHNGLPCTIIVSTTLQDPQSAAGVALTAGGSLLPMRDVIRLASQSHHYLRQTHPRTALLWPRQALRHPRQRIVSHAQDCIRVA